VILPGQMIRMRGIFSPFCERQVSYGMSYGLSCAGYDIRLKTDVTLIQGYTIVAPALEHIDMPPDLLGMVADKSTWARQGVQVQHTVIEPGWRGTLALELTYQPVLDNLDLSSWQAKPPEIKKVEAGTPIAQVVVHQLMAPAEKPYKGKYQNQGADDIGAKLEGLEPEKEVTWWKLTEDEGQKIIEKYIGYDVGKEESVIPNDIMNNKESIRPIKSDFAREMKTMGFWIDWDTRRQTWVAKSKDIKAAESWRR
jgi:dCTP deaminase